MKQPDNIHDALRHLHNLTLAIAEDLERYIDDEDMQYDAEYFEDVKAAALDAHLLVTWVKDNFKGLHQDGTAVQGEDRPSPTFVSARESALDEQAAMYDELYVDEDNRDD